MEEHIKNLVETCEKEGIEKSVYLFKAIYQCYSIEGWLKPDIATNICKFIIEKYPDLFDVVIRLNVQINLILRTLKEFGTKNQLEHYGKKVGAFALTENTTGVLSGLILDTEYSLENNEYILNSKDNNYKNWISQGTVADFLIVAAINGNDMRYFIVDLPVDGVEVNLKKNVGILDNQLDLAEIRFTDVKLGHGNVLQKSIEMGKKELLEGIFYGRYFIAEVTLIYMLGLIDRLIEKVENIEKFKKLGLIEYLNIEKKTLVYTEEYLEDIRNEKLENKDVIFINAIKVFICDHCIELFTKLKSKFTTYMLDEEVTLNHLIICKVAEGDTTVLRLSLLLDAVKKREFLKLELYSPIVWYELYRKNLPYIIDNINYLTDTLIDNIINKE